VVALARPVFRERLIQAAHDQDPAVRIGVLLALRRATMPEPDSLLRAWLNDPNQEIRRMALVWIGEEMRTIQLEDVSAVLFEAVACNATPFKTVAASSART
jgi:hypothetical protein